MTGARTKKVYDFGKMRLAFVGLIFAGAWLFLWWRAASVQLIQGDHLAGLARRQHLAAEFERGARGEIYDRQGRILAKSVTFTSIYARPLEIEDPSRVATDLAPILATTPKALMAMLDTKRPFVWLGRQIDDKAAVKLREKHRKGIYVTEEWGRLYPNGHLAGQLLGFTNVDGHGLEGLEKAYEENLAGKTAEFVVQRDASGRRLYLDAHGREVNINGADLRLTLDGNVQDMAETALAAAVSKHNARWGACVVLEVESGDILALANYPFFNPNIKAKGDPRAWRNRAITDSLEPGSVFKTFVIGAALQEKKIRPESVFHCENGKWTYKGRLVRDTHAAGDLTVNKIIRYSSNIGAGKIGLMLGSEKYHRYLSGLGFGERTNLGLPGESPGLLRPAKHWTEPDLVSTSFGQAIGVTSLQLAQGFAALANKGVRKPLRLVMQPEQDAPAEKRIYQAEVAEAVRSMMLEVVQEDGTGAALRIPGVPMAGKTGTAQKASASGGYGDSKYEAVFVAFVPGDKPKYVILTMIDEPRPAYYGGVVAGPVVRDVALNLLAYNGQLPDVALNVLNPATAGKPGIKAEAKMAKSPAPSLVPMPVQAAVDGEAVPDMTGLTLRRAVEMLVSRGAAPRLEGRGVTVARQSPEPGKPWPKGDNVVTLWLAG